MPPTSSMIRSVRTMSKFLLLDQPEPLAARAGDDAVVPHAFEALGHGLGVRLVVVDHKDADLGVHLRSSLPERQPEGEPRTLSGLALEGDRAAVGLDDLAGGGQAQAAAAGLGSRRRRRRPGEATSSVIPTPVSVTSSTAQSPSRRVWSISSPPSGMAWWALRIRFQSACLKRSTSSGTVDRSGSYWVRITIPWPIAWGSQKSRRSSTTALRSLGSVFRSWTLANRRKSSTMSLSRSVSLRTRSSFWRTRRSRGIRPPGNPRRAGRG